jgi:hypothetical protein
MSEVIADGWLTWVVSGLVATLASYFTTTGTINTKLASLETQVENIKDLLAENRADVKTLLREPRSRHE